MNQCFWISICPESTVALEDCYILGEERRDTTAPIASSSFIHVGEVPPDYSESVRGEREDERRGMPVPSCDHRCPGISKKL
jgi:hypothetical protein